MHIKLIDTKLALDLAYSRFCTSGSTNECLQVGCSVECFESEWGPFKTVMKSLVA